MEYTQEFKTAMIQKILLNPGTPMINFSKEANVPNSTVATWLRNYKKRNGSTVGSKKKTWSAERKFQAVLETASLSEAEKNEYCRKQGIYQEQLAEWKKDGISGCRKSPDQTFIKKIKQKEQELQRKTKALEKELTRKEKALAEAAALLVLKKKSPGHLGGQRGRMIPTEYKTQILSLVEEACKAGARQCKACEIIGISERTLQRWQKKTTAEIEDKRPHAEKNPANKLSKEEKQMIIDICNSQEYGSLPPSQIVPMLCDQGIYVASEASFYRTLRENGLQNHRGKTRYKTNKKPTGFIATGPNQVWTWDITYLPAALKGSFHYLYMIMDIYSRKIVAWEVHDRQSDDLASELVKRGYLSEGINGNEIVLHSDNGAPMKGATMLCTLQQLGVVPSFSRPSVSNDNPYSEALFKTLKYVPSYPSGPFESLEACREWVLNFVSWYNNDHRHSGIKFVTPNERHTGVDRTILEARQKVYLEAKAKNQNVGAVGSGIGR